MARAQGAVEQLIRSRVADHPDDTWLKWRDEEVPWRDVLSLAQRAANGLLELGVRPGERVAIMMANHPDFIWVHLGVLLIGASSVPVNISQRGATLAHILADSDATAVVFDEDLRDAVLAVRSDLPALRHLVVHGGQVGGEVDWDVERLLAGADREPDVELAEPTGGVGMMYTSGTTGPPKGVVATNYDLSPITTLLEASGVRPGETMYTGLPLFHGNALLVSMLGSIFIDARLALAPRFTASRFFDDLRRYDAAEFNTLGGMISILLKQPPRPDDRDNPVRVLLSAGCPPDRWREFEERFGVRIIEWFGMVDSPGILLNDAGRVGSMGRSGVSGVEFRVVDDDDRPVGPGTTGELVFRHPKGRMTTYHKLPEVTDEAYRNGWFHSGDLAEYDGDGFFYYRGRKTESMRRLGENISAWEIETVVNAHPGVLESAAHPVASELGEHEVKVCVVPRPDASVTPADILDFCVGRMARHAIPRYVEFLDELPKTATERNQYAALRARGVTPTTWDREQAGYQLQRS
ncbi:Long-chain-fatty-acid--CoA ligase [Pseudonocardia dioxanivorans CB1190]|uniref:Long-chain-fatty-acid--CoA ligase n=1 Tax=Pseudonocardia dioxanivorans (strain ATCC 55486 / DSM 44775 / JCM 13855 / CB1190) TaxID=675635 RepID=F4CKT3_PSEUX|nr:AMP-binding protein [Pseudonocardia dioxanivorans]AEA23571.1 Long-chain-fatty-acid--CoA ligase [Pseudonocardia dioxanivorans CB1190]